MTLGVQQLANKIVGFAGIVDEDRCSSRFLPLLYPDTVFLGLFSGDYAIVKQAERQRLTQFIAMLWRIGIE